VILVNGKKVDYETGMTVSTLLEKLKFVFPMLIVRINGTLVERDAYKKTPVADSDTVEVIHLMSGG
jgi:sulfur carrier protein